MAVPYSGRTGPLLRGRRSAEDSARVRRRSGTHRGVWTRDAVGMLVLVLLLSAVGLVFVASSSSVYSLHRFGSSWALFERQVIFVAIGIVALAVSVFIPYQVWHRFAALIAFVSLIGVALTFTPLGISKNGSARWIGPSSFAVQPSEFLKFGVAALFAASLVRIEGHYDEQRKIRNQLFIAFVFGVGPVLLQPDMGTAMVTSAILIAMVVATGLPFRNIAMVLGTGLFLTVIAAIAEPYRRDRMLAFLNPGHDPTGIGYHVMQSKLGFASGQLFGVGIGASRSKWGFLPNSYTDFIYAIIGEELGLIGALLILVGFLTVALLGIRIARRSNDRFGALLAVGLTTWIVAQAVINIGAVIGTVPVTGVPLPFISMGGSSFIVMMLSVGVLINIARHGRQGRPGQRVR